MRDDDIGYRFIDSPHGLGRCMVVTGPWKSGFANAFRDAGAQVVRLSDRVGWRPASVAFLTELEPRGVEIVSDDIVDVSPIELMSSIELLHLDCETTSPLDVSSLHKLKFALVAWPRAGFVGLLEAAELEYLNIERYPHSDLTPICSPKLTRLDVVSRKLVSLNGVDRLTCLDMLDLLDCHALRDIAAVASAKRLRVLSLVNCKRVTSLSPLSGLPGIQRVIVENSPELESVHPLLACQSLSHVVLAGSTKISDGDVAALLAHSGLQVFTFRNRRHYNAKFKEVAAELERRHGPPTF